MGLRVSLVGMTPKVILYRCLCTVERNVVTPELHIERFRAGCNVLRKDKYVDTVVEIPCMTQQRGSLWLLAYFVYREVK